MNAFDLGVQDAFVKHASKNVRRAVESIAKANRHLPSGPGQAVHDIKNRELAHFWGRTGSTVGRDAVATQRAANQAAPNVGRLNPLASKMRPNLPG
jgi:hypothetical protein